MLITGDVTFNGNNTISGNAQIFVKDNVEITISNGATLTINSGTILKFANNAGLTVNGTLNANGTSSNQVTFTRSGTSGSWDGIEFKANSSGTMA